MMEDAMKRLNLAIIAILMLFAPATVSAFEPIFDTRIDYPIGIQCRSVCATDLNGDGYDDFVASYVFNLSIYLNNGNGTFQFFGDIIPGGVETIAAADLDGDNDNDLVLSIGGPDVLVLINNGDATFQPPVSYGQKSNNDNTISSLKNQVGKAAFAPQVVSRCIFLSDLDGDNDPDIVTSKGSIKINNGDGTFNSGDSISISGVSVYASDLDGDSDFDLAFSSFNDSVTIYLNNGNATFLIDGIYSVGVNPISIYAADFDGDGDSDLATSNEGSKDVSILNNDGAGSFQLTATYNVTGIPYTLVACDYNDDGYDDISVTQTGISASSILINNGDGTFQGQVDYPVGDGPHTVFASDVNNDGHVDMLTANAAPGTVSVLPNNGDGTFAQAIDYDTEYGSHSVCVSDFNGDEAMDFATASVRISVFINNGDNTFQPPVYYDAPNYQVAILASDLNNDGFSDLVTANEYAGNISVRLNNGDGTFGVTINYDVGSYPSQVIASDFDLDGFIDLAVCHRHTDDLYVFINNGNGTLQSPIFYNTGASMSLFAEDLDDDGDFDIALSNGLILLNDGFGLFPSIHDIGVGGDAISVADLDEDCFNDLAITAGDSVFILINEGDADFYAAESYFIGYSGYAISISDINSDNIYDLVIADYYGSNISVLYGNSDGTFQKATHYGVGRGPTSLVTTDINGDKAIDVAVAMSYTNNVSILYNELLIAQSVSGKVIYYDMAKTVPYVDIELTGTQQHSMMACGDATFGFHNLIPGNYSLSAQKNTNDSGVSVADCVMLRRHIAELEILDIPYKYIAADVNGSTEVTVADIIKIRRYIAHLDSIPIGNWKFIDSGFNITSENWRIAPESVYVELSNDDITNLNLIGIRMGDVNNSWTTISSSKLGTELAKNIRLKDVHGKPGDTISIPLYIDNNTAIAGIELHLNYDKNNLEFSHVSSILAGEKTVNAINNNIHIVWEDIQNVAITSEEQPLINIDFVIRDALMGETEIELTGAEIVDLRGRPYKIKLSNCKVIKSYSSQVSPVLPNEYVLEQNRPNPFNPITEIRFSLPEASDVCLEIFNIMGQRVQTLVNEPLEAGYHSYTWDASSYASGIYFTRLRAGTFIDTKKMILLK